MTGIKATIMGAALTGLVGVTGTGSWWLATDYVEHREIASNADIRSLRNKIDWLQRLVWAQQDRIAAGGNTPSARDRLRELQQQLARAKAELARRQR